MFSKNQVKESNVEFDKFDTLIGKNSSFEGTLKATGTIRIDGELHGELIISGDVFIGESSKIIGNIAATNIVISGLVEGNINASDKIRITSNGRLVGDVSVKSIIVDEDAFFEGKCKMIDLKQISEKID
ncbi:bactofilin family protein [Serpentinicella alkaliphila]|uniref:Cytoskeletal protein CcmA (Bactofilin family) n=1 Tax=Serpentinicella alkaliphila TaxID=1734049 RepID=A0A4V2T1Z2_9FIRM|nr:polymer-forming cytoskeletal protein [Serpentinicella alkaliphila]QUH26958.1 polymer-forming cytoskeletal protein [Serpentinicella alkaliphila]TCP95403.1 cytoskeletal protein CcmA (bactofilin family) [Serpentinicella alkaliphila]